MQQGLSHLQELLQQSTSRLKIKGNPIPLYSLIYQLQITMREYIQSECKGSWIDSIVKDKKSGSLAQLIQSWIFYSTDSLECQLLAALSIVNDRRKLQLFLRMRKFIAQLLSNQKMDELQLKHEDTITIIHRMFPVAVRKQISRGVKQIFVKCRITDARISACVFIQYILSVYDSISEGEQSLMLGETKNSSIHISNFSSIQNFTTNLYKHQSLVRNGQKMGYNIIEAKFLPQEMERRKTNLGVEGQQSYYYSNSLNFSQQKSYPRNNHNPTYDSREEKQNMSMNKYENTSHFTEVKKQILIEESSNYSFESMLQTLGNNIPLELQQLAVRNNFFKKKMLTSNGFEVEMSEKQESSISEAVNIIHASIVRHHHFSSHLSSNM